MMNREEIQDGTLSILIEIGGEVHMVGMNKEKLEGLSVLIKQAIELVVPAGKTQNELREFLGYTPKEGGTK